MTVEKARLPSPESASRVTDLVQKVCYSACKYVDISQVILLDGNLGNSAIAQMSSFHNFFSFCNEISD